MSILKQLQIIIDEKEDFRDAHDAPSADHDDVKTKMDESGDFSLREVVLGYHLVPKEFFTPAGVRYYNTPEGRESAAAIDEISRAINNGHERTITAYRAVPLYVDIDKLIKGDWVTFSKKYAIGHGEHRFGENKYKLIVQEVSPDEVWWDGNDINEWGYDPT